MRSVDQTYIATLFNGCTCTHVRRSRVLHHNFMFSLSLWQFANVLCACTCVHIFLCTELQFICVHVAMEVFKKFIHGACVYTLALNVCGECKVHNYSPCFTLVAFVSFACNQECIYSWCNIIVSTNDVHNVDCEISEEEQFVIVRYLSSSVKRYFRRGMYNCSCSIKTLHVHTMCCGKFSPECCPRFWWVL